MVYDSTKILLRSIVLSLEAKNEAEWDEHIESGRECLYEMHQMTRTLCVASTRPVGRSPHVERLHRAMPHVKNMVGAMRRKDHATALESGKAALAEL
jgi:hypothetical protein